MTKRRIKRFCIICNSTKELRKHRDHLFCQKHIKFNKKGNMLWVSCPYHYNRCGGKYGPCAACLGQPDTNLLF